MVKPPRGPRAAPLVGSTGSAPCGVQGAVLLVVVLLTGQLAGVEGAAPSKKKRSTNNFFFFSMEHITNLFNLYGTSETKQNHDQIDYRLFSRATVKKKKCFSFVTTNLFNLYGTDYITMADYQ